ncbi:aminodeoxychorismate/anthranilate synthase component II [Staphylococcus chromogenes]|uniref:anthranilate synthase component II n=1 Tax=Staphylococcus chromogenes TaxID=46126 RepID=UPI0021D2786F|nr:aminodeoxychorismate/anthranilate synthase component II [Staphylococcus chromogenes]UXS67506.1 aminodeoxychorismate/anthranilate synthase component II [Staphylococcus chromogenes]
MIVMIDNKDSFTYNVVDLLHEATTCQIEVIDISHVDVTQLKEMKPQAIVISPGPGTPRDYPILFEIIRQFESQCPILGVCLGFQLICEYYGGDIVKAPSPVHGHTTEMFHNQMDLYEGLPSPFKVMRYHSLMVDAETVHSPLVVTSQNEEGIIMGVKHENYPIYGVQYHPESVLSEYGQAQMMNFLSKVGVQYGCHI